jgi:TRAP-type C4-dicarboxylate transport system permease small subunit
MTIRQYIKRRLMWSLAVAIVAIVFIVISSIVGNPKDNVPIVTIGALVFLAVVAFINLGIRCAKCGGNLGMTIVPAFLSFSSKKKINYCPFCGVSIDENC